MILRLYAGKPDRTIITSSRSSRHARHPRDLPENWKWDCLHCLVRAVQFKNLGLSHVGILSWGNLIDPNSYIDNTILLLLYCCWLGTASYPRLRRGRLLGASINDVPISYDRLGWKSIRNGAWNGAYNATPLLKKEVLHCRETLPDCKWILWCRKAYNWTR